MATIENYNVKVSVIMPVYNSGEYLKTAVDSILNQSLKEIELILVDDGSTDGSSERCDEYAQQDNRVVVIHQKNGGICNARNAALKITRGEYIGFSDHDDEFALEAFEKAYSFATKNNLDMVKFGHKAIKTDGKAILKIWSFEYEEKIYEAKESLKHYLEMLYCGQMECVWDSLYRKEFLDRYDLRLNPDFTAGEEDVDFNGRVLGNSPKIGIMPEVFYYHYIRVGFSTSTKFKEVNIRNAISFPMRLNEYLSSADSDKIYRNNKELYAETIIYRSVGSLLFGTAMPACNYTKKEIRSLLKQISEDRDIYPCFWKASKMKILRKSLKYGILYWAFTKGYYNLCISLYHLRNSRDKASSNAVISNVLNKLNGGAKKR
ncbi:glycosyltransferase family 2 protein [Bacteroides gallinaceum]|uniref:glycosyltransferase family 2 protein n=1 Tax=Bacteroides gallinaceum TaxID=1462571 RepID=UPI0025AA71E3|nr:glycosyltransferase family 2 protein [Bacteroides gallinaceum]MDN0066645.1 glycosyltransferase family 2 protein [Bacteroides gallinaceum]